MTSPPARPWVRTAWPRSARSVGRLTFRDSIASTSAAPGDHSITYVLGGRCDEVEATVLVSDPVSQATVFSYETDDPVVRGLGPKENVQQMRGRLDDAETLTMTITDPHGADAFGTPKVRCDPAAELS